jgi:hypothetical protein
LADLQRALSSEVSPPAATSAARDRAQLEQLQQEAATLAAELATAQQALQDAHTALATTATAHATAVGVRGRTGNNVAIATGIWLSHASGALAGAGVTVEVTAQLTALDAALQAQAATRQSTQQALRKQTADARLHGRM